MGHGVGLCQKGASAMGSHGRSALQILDEYFPRTQAADEASGIAWKHLDGDGFRLESLDSADAAYMPDLARARAEASQRSGLNTTALFTVRAFSSTAAFRSAMLAPGWVAAFTEGDWIGTQPLRTLAGRRLLAPTMLHEFLHALVEREAGPRTPLWLREGLVETWNESGRAGNSPSTGGPMPTLTPDAIDKALAHADSEAQSETAHRAAGWYTARLLNRYGRVQVLIWLRSGLPGGVIADVR
jgi:hypothetical protein